MVEAAMEGASSPPGRWMPWLFAALTASLVLAAEQTIELFQRRSLVQHERTHVIDQLAQLRARLESAINGNLLMIQGLTATIAAQPDIDQEGFARIARGLISAQHPLRNIGGAPGLILSLMYPLDGNEAAIGLDYRTHPGQRDAALRAIETGLPVIAGPLPLVQGGTGLIARQAVFVPDASGGADRRLWGLVSAVLDVDELYRLAGLPTKGVYAGLHLAIRGKDGTGAGGAVFYGDPGIFQRDPVTVAVSLPAGSWQLAAIPVDGWVARQHGHELTLVRLAGFTLTLLLGAMVYLLTRGTQALRHTANQLQKSQSMFTGFMDNLPAGAFVRDPRDGTTLLENRWLRQNLPGHRQDGDVETANDLQALEAGSLLLQRQVRSGVGGPRYCDTLRFVLPDTGKAPLIGAIVMDVSERVAAENDLVANRARLRALFDTIPDLVWLKDPDGVYLACNRRFEALFGASEAEIVGRRDPDFVPANLADFYRLSDLDAVQAGGPTTSDETVTFASDGHQELLETIRAPVFDEDGELIGVLGISRDVTQRREAERQLGESARRLAAAESIAHIGNWEFSVEDGRIVWSDEAYRIFGLAPQDREIDYDWLRSRVIEDDRATHDEYLHRILASRPGDSLPEYRCRMRRMDGEVRSLSIVVRVEHSAEGLPVRAFGTVQDVTERDALQRDLQSRLAELTRWQKVILGREDRIQELKREVNDLLAGQDQPARYAGPPDRP